MVVVPVDDVTKELVAASTDSTLPAKVSPEITVFSAFTPAYQLLPALLTNPTVGSVMLAAFVMTTNPPAVVVPLVKFVISMSMVT